MWGIPNASKGGTKSEVAHKWADWLHHQCCLGGPRYFKAGDKIKSGSQVGLLATSSLPQHPTIPPIPLESRDAWCAKVACTLHSSNPGRWRLMQSWLHHLAFTEAQKWVELLPNTCVLGGPKTGDEIRSGCVTPAFLGARNWAELLCKPCVLGGPAKRGQNHHSRGLPPLQNGVQNQKWPTSGLIGYITHVV